MEKRGDLRPDSHSDFDTREKVSFVDSSSPYVAGEKDKDKLKAPVPLKEDKGWKLLDPDYKATITVVP